MQNISYWIVVYFEWLASWEYEKVSSHKHVFKSTLQFNDAELTFTTKELMSTIKNGEIYNQTSAY